MMTSLYDAVALIAIFLCVYVMQATEHDQINRVDVWWLQWMRRGGFTFAALAAAYSIICRDWDRTLPVVLLVGAADALLLVNAIALYRRSAHPPAKKAHIAVRSHKRAF